MAKTHAGESSAERSAKEKKSSDVSGGFADRSHGVELGEEFGKGDGNDWHF
jgi:hypothetical protein